jgi:capsular exopolysaccharide synthesis family protein
MKDTQILPYKSHPNEAIEAALIRVESVNLLQYLRIIRRHKWGIFSITLISVVVGALIAFSATPIYQAKSILLADPIAPTANVSDGYSNTALIHLFYETQHQIILSRTVAESVANKLNLLEKHKLTKINNRPDTEEANSVVQTIKSQISTALDWREWLPKGLWSAPIPEPNDKQLFHELVSSIQSRIEVEGDKQSKIISISYTSPDPQQAADVVNAVADAYIEFSLNSRLSGAKKTANWLNEQLTILKKNLHNSEDALESFQRKQGLVNSDQQQQIANTQLSTLNKELIKAQTKRSEAEILYNQVVNLGGDKDNYDSLEPVLNNQAVRTLVQEEAKFSRRVKELSERYGDKHPKMIAARSDLKQSRATRKHEIDKVVNNITKQYNLTIAHERKIASLIRQQKQEIGELKGISIELTRLERDVENNRRIYETFLSRFQEADVSDEYDASNVLIVDTANTPFLPYKPNKPKVIVISGVLGVFFGLLIAFARESFDNTFKNTDIIEEKLGTSSLGIVPMVVKPTVPEKQFFNDPRSHFSENINNIRTGLLFANIDQPPQVILVTSASSSEGKSTLAISLAASLGQLEHTLLLEADLRKPSIAYSMQLKNTPGLSDLLSNRCKIKDVGFTKIGGEHTHLHTISCGTLPPNPLELLSSKNFEVLVDQLRNRFKYIVIDAPPLLAVSDAIVLAQAADSIVLAIKAEATTVKMAREALSRLNKSNAKVTGCVLTLAATKRMSYYGDNYYHHYAGYYGTKVPKSDEAA